MAGNITHIDNNVAVTAGVVTTMTTIASFLGYPEIGTILGAIISLLLPNFNKRG